MLKVHPSTETTFASTRRVAPRAGCRVASARALASRRGQAGAYLIAVIGIVVAGCGGMTGGTTTSAVVKEGPLRWASECEAIPAGARGQRAAKSWLLRLPVVRSAERFQKGLAARNATELQAYCR